MQKYLSYFLRLLGSRMQSSNFEEEQHIKTLILKKLQAAKKPRHGTTHSDALRFEELLDRLKKLKLLQRKGAILYLLYKTSKVEHAEASGELFTSLFAQQVGNKVDYAENGKRKKAEEMAVD